MSRRSAAVIFRDESVLLIHRIVEGEQFYVLPGGSIEREETPEEAAVREVREESGLEAAPIGVIGEIAASDHNNHTYVVACEAPEGEPVWQETDKMTPTNVYQFEWVPVAELETLELKPEEAVGMIREYVEKLA